MFFRLTSTLLPFALSLWLLEGNIFRSHIEDHLAMEVGFRLNTVIWVHGKIVNERKLHFAFAIENPDFQVVKQFITDHTCCEDPCGQSEQKEKGQKKGTSTTKFLLGFDKQWTTKKLHPYVQVWLDVRPCRTDFTPCGLQERALPPPSLAIKGLKGTSPMTRKWLDPHVFIKKVRKRVGCGSQFSSFVSSNFFCPLNKSITRLNQQVFSHFLEQS